MSTSSDLPDGLIDLHSLAEQMFPDSFALSYQDSLATTGPRPTAEFDVSEFQRKNTPEPAHSYTEKNGRGYIETSVSNLTKPDQIDLRRQILTECGLDPDECRIVGRVSISRSRWTSGANVNHAKRYRYQVEFTNPMVEDLLAEVAILSDVERFTPPPRTNGNRVAVLVLADTQIGKADNGGTEGIMERIGATLNAFRKKVIAERPDAVALFYPGDCIEGNQSQGGKNMGPGTHLTISEQTRVFRRVVEASVKLLAPVSPELHVGTVNGNHDEAQRIPVSTKEGDGWATEMAIAAEDSIRNANDTVKELWAQNEDGGEVVGPYDHVHFHYPADHRAYMVVEIKDSSFLVSHGHKWRRGKAGDWWTKHAISMTPGAMSQFLIHGHEHSAYFTQLGAHRTIVCAPTMEGGSDWYDGVYPGIACRRGGSYFIASGGDWENYSII